MLAIFQAVFVRLDLFKGMQRARSGDFFINPRLVNLHGRQRQEKLRPVWNPAPRTEARLL